MVKQLPHELINILKRLDENQLQATYKLLVEQLKLINKTKALRKMKKFNLMDWVSFVHNGKRYEGFINRFNQRSVTVLLDDGHLWNVSPQILKKIKGRENPLMTIMTEKQRQKLKNINIFR